MKPDKKIDISAIILFFNHGKYIREALQSVMGQTLGNHEIFIVDDSSSDQGSIEVLQQLQQEFPQITFLQTKKTIGLAGARNLGVQYAKGEFVCFLDAYDKMDPTFLEKSVLLLRQKKGIHFVYTDIQHFDEDEETQKAMDPYNFCELLFQNPIPYCAVIRREAFSKVGGYDESLCEEEIADWDFWIRMGKKRFFGYCLREPLFYSRKAEDVRSHEARRNDDQIVETLRNRHRWLFMPWNLLKLKLIWAGKGKQRIADKIFQHLPGFLQQNALKFYGAELLEGENWRKAPGKCFQLMIPVVLRRKMNQTLRKDIFHEKTKFSQLSFNSGRGSLSSVEKKGSPSLRQSGGTSPLDGGIKKQPVFVFLPWTPMGGVETLLLNIFCHLALEFHFIVFTTEPNANSLHPQFAKGAIVYHLPNLFSKGQDRIDFIREKIVEFGVKKLFIVNCLFIFKFIPHLKNEFPDLSISTSLHGWDEQFDFLSMAELFFPFLDHVVCVSKPVKKRFEEQLGYRDPKILLIQNTIDFEALETQKRQSVVLPVLKKNGQMEKNIVFLGRYNFDKNPHFFVDIANYFVTDLNMTHFRFFLFGEGVEEKSLIKKAQEINLRAGKEIVFVGKKQSNIAQIYGEADACVNCSLREGFGMTALESLYFGVPFVGFDLDVFEESLPEKYFLRISQTLKNPVSSFAEQICLASQREITGQDRWEMKQWVKDHFDSEHFIEAYRDIFREEFG